MPESKRVERCLKRLSEADLSDDEWEALALAISASKGLTDMLDGYLTVAKHGDSARAKVSYAKERYA